MMMDGVFMGFVRVYENGKCRVCGKEAPMIWETRFPDGRIAALCKSDMIKASIFLGGPSDADEATAMENGNGRDTTVMERR